MSDHIDAHDFYNEYHGHLIDHLETLHGRLVKEQKVKTIIFFVGDSSLDNKHWLFAVPKQTATLNEKKFTAAACNGYEKILKPPRMVQDVAYWLNWEIANNLKAGTSACINASIEESALGERDSGVLLPQDKFVRDHIGQDDVLVVSVGGNDIALKPTCCTAFNMAMLIFCSCTCCIECACGVGLPCCCSPAFPMGLGHFLNLFKCKVEDYVRRIVVKRKPRKVVVCMIYYLDQKPGGSWADKVLGILGYNTNPKKLQTLIRKVFELATEKINIPGTEVVAFPLFKVLDGKNTNDYDNRVEPSVQGGAKMGRALFRCIYNEDGMEGADGYGTIGDDTKKN
mmetsp:Transcript_32458/g.79042  ORF Transcript_32458/g.79042 Transcript_32458/m.79042 type:complete len:340 (+) Transcript_32458:186-1205(+)